MGGRSDEESVQCDETCWAHSRFSGGMRASTSLLFMARS